MTAFLSDSCCSYKTTSPLPQTIWHKNGSTVQTSERVKVWNYGKILHISSARNEDKGIYSCHVRNGVGPTQVHDIELDVVGIQSSYITYTVFNNVVTGNELNEYNLIIISCAIFHHQSENCGKDSW